MKKLILLGFLVIVPISLPHQVEARQIVLDIPDSDIKIAEHDVPDAEQWIRDAWKGKLSKSKSNLFNQEVDRSSKNNETLPAGEAAILQKALDRPDYESRKTRDARILQQALEISKIKK